ncbi:MAG: hypothetical protein U5N86_07230 [Planctomycetota bacterium]|nr:hypothetical protein [Planctomycetota bacterium]
MKFFPLLFRVFAAVLLGVMLVVLLYYSAEGIGLISHGNGDGRTGVDVWVLEGTFSTEDLASRDGFSLEEGKLFFDGKHVRMTLIKGGDLMRRIQAAAASGNLPDIAPVPRWAGSHFEHTTNAECFGSEPLSENVARALGEDGHAAPTAFGLPLRISFQPAGALAKGFVKAALNGETELEPDDACVLVQHSLKNGVDVKTNGLDRPHLAALICSGSSVMTLDKCLQMFSEPLSDVSDRLFVTFSLDAREDERAIDLVSGGSRIVEFFAWCSFDESTNQLAQALADAGCDYGVSAGYSTNCLKRLTYPYYAQSANYLSILSSVRGAK